MCMSEIDKLFDLNNREPLELYDFNDKPAKLLHIGTLEYNDKMYAVLEPLGEGTDGGVIIYEIINYKKKGHDAYLKAVESEEYENEILAYFNRLIKEEINDEEK